MSRTFAAFIIAPLWVPLTASVYAPLAMFPYPEQRHWVLITTLISAFFTYLGVLGLGVPAFLFLRSRKMTALWIACVAGIVVGTVMWTVFVVCFALSLDGLEGARQAFTQTPTSVHLAGFIAPALLGLIVGTTFWLIARPDRKLS
jgi:hypothetical protein